MRSIPRQRHLHMWQKDCADPFGLPIKSWLASPSMPLSAAEASILRAHYCRDSNTNEMLRTRERVSEQASKLLPQKAFVSLQKSEGFILLTDCDTSD